MVTKRKNLSKKTRFEVFEAWDSDAFADIVLAAQICDGWIGFKTIINNVFGECY